MGLLAAALPAGIGLVGGLLNANASRDAANAQAAGQVQAAQIAADAARFRPVGVTTAFGSSNFGFDPQGYLNSAGYTMPDWMRGQQNQLQGASGGYLNQFLGAQGATAPMGAGAQGMFNLGQQYLGTSPQAQAQQYMQDQQALLQPGRESAMAGLMSRLQAQGRMGLAVGGGVNSAAANPELNAYYNAIGQQDRDLAARATQGGMDYAKFGAGMMGLGGDMLGSMYGTQSAAYAPYQTAIGGMQGLEGMSQDAMRLGMSLGNTATAANASSGQLLGQGMMNAANTIGANAQQRGSMWGNVLQGMAPVFQNYNWNSGGNPLTDQQAQNLWMTGAR